MSVITYRKLNDKLQESLSQGKLPEKNVRELSEQIKAQNKKEVKSAAIITGVLAVIFGGGLLAITVSSKSIQSVLLGWIIGYLVLVGFSFFAAYMVSIGIIKLEYNSALKEGYPDLYKECKV